jgi:hypothetical protein
MYVPHVLITAKLVNYTAAKRNLQDVRLRAVLEATAARFDWGTPLAAGHGAGIAGGIEKGSYVATCVEQQHEG